MYRDLAIKSSIALLFLLPMSARAADAMSACIDRAGGVMPAMIECLKNASAIEDRRLNDAYRALMRELSPRRRETLRAAQRDWILFRDSNASYYYDPEGGQDAHLLSVSRYHEMTKDRADELESLLAMQKL